MAVNNKSRFYNCWADMKKRCLNPKYRLFKDYGGRGIGICPEWLQFANFEKDMQGSYFPDLFLDRIDNNRGYSKENCRWATREQQNNNKRNNRYIEFDNESLTIPQWSRKLNIKRSTLAQRFYVYKWSIDKCFSLGGQIGC